MIDVLKHIDSSNDLVIKNNDLLLGVSDMQHKHDLIVTEKGSIKQYPEAGVGAYTFIESENRTGLIREIALQYSADGMKVKGLDLDDQGLLTVDADYE